MDYITATRIANAYQAGDETMHIANAYQAGDETMHIANAYQAGDETMHIANAYQAWDETTNLCLEQSLTHFLKWFLSYGKSAILIEFDVVACVLTYRCVDV